MKTVVYVAGPYSPYLQPTASGTQYISRAENVFAARKVAIQLWQQGFAVLCPHLNTAGFEQDCTATYQDYIEADLIFLSTCDAIVMLPDWRLSQGACIEYDYAQGLGIPIYEWPEIPAISPTITKYPQQCQMFREELGKMYRLHLTKNQDYSPANVGGPGMLGIAVRLWDKAVRMVNLHGVDVEVVESNINILLLIFIGVTELCRRRGIRIKSALHWIGQQREPKHEAIEDTFIDVSIYGIIGKIAKYGKWGH